MSNPAVVDRSTDVRDEVFDALADASRREILRIAHDRSPVRKSDLAFEFAAVTADKPLAEVTDEEHQRARIDCHHRSLPALLDAGLLEERDEETVATTDHWAFEDAQITAVVEGELTEDDAELDGLFEALADARRRTICAVLANQYHPISTETLARDVAAREAETSERDVSQERVDAVLTSLVHVHLPLLNDAGLVGYDAETETVSYEGHPVLRAGWLEDGTDDAATDDSASTVTATDEGDVRTLQGRDSIITTGQSLCEEAEDELFMMFTTTGLLEEGCFRRIEDAIDRGVDVYLGSRDPRVRELVRERAPEVTLWEPQFDWLNLPPNGESVGRLVFADRDAVLLGTFGPAGDDDHAETAIVGSGPDNGLVVLMRQLLGSRVDHLDARDDEPLSEIPL